MYAVKEIFFTLQGEGFHAGKAAVFCRFSGCNLWSGREADRAAAACRFCDTDFVGSDGLNGGKFRSAKLLADKIASLWPSTTLARPFAVFTGGEPLLQLDDRLLGEMHARNYYCAVETNGTLTPLPGIDWVTVSPKGTASLALTKADEIKLVFPQADAAPSTFEAFDAQHHFLQPMDGPEREANTRDAVSYCKSHPKWRLSLQTHKYLGIP